MIIVVKQINVIISVNIFSTFHFRKAILIIGFVTLRICVISKYLFFTLSSLQMRGDVLQIILDVDNNSRKY